MSCNVVILNETKINKGDGWSLCFQYCKYVYDEGSINGEYGYRFIWRKPDGTLQPARGQARIPKMTDIMYLTSTAILEGWGEE